MVTAAEKNAKADPVTTDKSPNERKAEEIISNCDTLFGEQKEWRHTWQDISDYVIPRKSNIETKEVEGEVRTHERYDDTAEDAMETMAAGVLGWIAPAGEQWFRFEPINKDAPQSVKTWLQECSEIAVESIYSSNFYLGFHEALIDACAFGTMSTFVDEGKRRDLNFSTLAIGSYAIAEDDEGFVDTLYRKFEYTARQAMLKWGEDALSVPMKEAFKSANGSDRTRKFEVIQALYPRAEGEYREGPAVPEDERPVACDYVCRTGKHVLRETGYYEFPAPVTRILRANVGIYGRSRAMTMLPTIKMLNRIALDTTITIEQVSQPGWLAPYDLAFEPSNRPNDVTRWDASNPNNKPEQLKYENRIDLAEGLMEQKRNAIRRAFFNDMFQMLTEANEANRQKTAYEVSKMVEERLTLFSPIFARITEEGLTPILERVFSILLRKNRFPMAPPEAALSGGYKLTYISRLALAIKALRNRQIMQGAEILGMLSEIDPGVRHVVDTMGMARSALENIGVESDHIRPEEEVAAIIEQEAQAEQAAQAAATAEQGAKAVGALPEAAQNQVIDFAQASA